ncbi:bile acid-CoA:amino acid N-acyltransferase-like isoform X2 [Lagopus leucura]|uniref:bile acid-CoA:amino acid N-acyltransferase-like isoform X2 n=1 Tax=Lagopus leucura TaxID=30410 RepID=UPI001C67E4ED|nr:bile acid-CoA:amino acid N-acyltransferase-like isoform X2 [Lagopus leucura]
MVEVMVMPSSSLADQMVQVVVSGLAPSQLVTLRSWLMDEHGERFQARAFYRSDEEGTVDVGRHAALGGNYSGIWPMGLFWFLQPDNLFKRLVKRDVMGSPFLIHLEVFDGLRLVSGQQDEPLATCTAERWYVGPGVQRVPIREGRVRGALLLPPGPGPFPAVIDLFGGAGGLIEFRAGLLASRGFAVLALAFFAYEDLPKGLTQLDLDYFEEAAELLLQHPKTERMLFTELGAMDNSAIFTDPRSPACSSSAIPVEKIQGKVLFVVGEADRSFNSKLFAQLAAERLPQDAYRLLSYPGAGHLIEPPGSPLCSISSLRGNPLPVVWGGEPQPHARAQQHSWQEIVQFLELHLSPAPAIKL